MKAIPCEKLPRYWRFPTTACATPFREQYKQAMNRTEREASVLNWVSSLTNRRLTGPQLAASLNSTRKTSVSTSTLKRWLWDAGPLGRVAKQKPYLTMANKRKRLRWTKEHRQWTEEDWEKKSVMDRQINRTSEKMLEECLMPSAKHGGGNVMVYGCFSAGKVGDLYKVKEILYSEGYHSILQCHAIPCGQCLIEANFLQQDNDPKHTSKLHKNCLEKKQSAGILSVMEWPAQSPDLNPVKLLWEQLDNMVRAHQANPTCVKCFRKCGVKFLQFTSTNWQLECQRSTRL